MMSLSSTSATFDAAIRRAALFDRPDRGLLVLTGRDRAAWLHNLVTNAVKPLSPGDGAYAFACDVKGRVQFDLHILCREGELWLDVDRGIAPAALRHLERFAITEDVQLVDHSEAWGRLAVVGPATADAAAALGIADFAALPPLAGRRAGDVEWAFRLDYGASPGLELIAAPHVIHELRARLARTLDLPIGDAATLDAIRIDAGVPQFGREIDDRTLPAETGQLARAVSFHKGCYLGQEVVERMRSHNVLPRRLVRIRIDAAAAPAAPTALRRGDAEVGRITSLVRDPRDGGWIGLAYLKTAADTPGLTAGDPPAAVTILPAG